MDGRTCRKGNLNDCSVSGLPWQPRELEAIYVDWPAADRESTYNLIPMYKVID
jgi:hypothetical protein